MEKYISCSYGEWQKAQKPGQEEYKQSLIDETYSAIDDISYQVKRGTELVYNFIVDRWAYAVVKSALGIDRGGIIRATIEIMDAIEQDHIEKATEIFEGLKLNDNSKDTVRKNVMTFSKNGYPFYEATHHGDWTEDECEVVFEVFNMLDEYEESQDLVDVSESREKNEAIYQKIKNQSKSIL